MLRAVSAVLLGLCLLASCSKDKTASTPITPGGGDNINDTAIAFNGMFAATTGITVNGNAKIIAVDTSYFVVLDSFMVSSGPDLKVYLSKQSTPVDFINLGALKSLSGNSTYAIPAGVDFDAYKYVLIHCQQYNHLFAIAQLKP